MSNQKETSFAGKIYCEQDRYGNRKEVATLDSAEQGTYHNSTSGLLANTLKAAIDELASFPRCLPSGVVIDLVNRGHSIMQTDGLLLTSFDTSTTAYRNIAGGFNGTGQGNKQFVSINKHSGISFGNLTSLEFVAKLMNGANNRVFFNIQVDLVGNGNAADVAILIPKASNLFVLGTSNTTQSVNVTGQVWACVGGSGANGGSPVAGKAGIPNYTDQSSGFFCTLAHIMQYNPNAKLWNGAMLDGGQPKNASLGAVQIVMGSSGTQDYSRNCLYSAKVGLSGVNYAYQFGKPI